MLITVNGSLSVCPAVLVCVCTFTVHVVSLRVLTQFSFLFNEDKVRHDLYRVVSLAVSLLSKTYMYSKQSFNDVL